MEERAQMLRALALEQLQRIGAASVMTAEQAVLRAVFEYLHSAPLTARRINGAHPRTTGDHCRYATEHWSLTLSHGRRSPSVRVTTCVDETRHSQLAPYLEPASVAIELTSGGRWSTYVDVESLRLAFDSVAASTGGSPLDARIAEAIEHAKASEG